jgi:hypothetical protein
VADRHRYNAGIVTMESPQNWPGALGADRCSPAPLAAVAASRVQLVLLAVFCMLTVIVVVNILIAMVSTTFKAVKEQEEAHVLRNYARIIDEIEASMSEQQRQMLNSKLLTFVHVLEPQQAVSWLAAGMQVGRAKGASNTVGQGQTGSGTGGGRGGAGGGGSGIGSGADSSDVVGSSSSTEGAGRADLASQLALLQQDMRGFTQALQALQEQQAALLEAVQQSTSASLRSPLELQLKDGKTHVVGGGIKSIQEAGRLGAGLGSACCSKRLRFPQSGLATAMLSAHRLMNFGWGLTCRPRPPCRALPAAWRGSSSTLSSCWMLQGWPR